MHEIKFYKFDFMHFLILLWFCPHLLIMLLLGIGYIAYSNLPLPFISFVHYPFDSPFAKDP